MPSTSQYHTGPTITYLSNSSELKNPNQPDSDVWVIFTVWSVGQNTTSMSTAVPQINCRLGPHQHQYHMIRTKAPLLQRAKLKWNRTKREQNRDPRNCKTAQANLTKPSGYIETNRVYWSLKSLRSNLWFASRLTWHYSEPTVSTINSTNLYFTHVYLQQGYGAESTIFFQNKRIFFKYHR